MCLFAGTIGTPAFAESDSMQAKSLRAFDEWSAIAAAEHESPAYLGSRTFDLKATWNGPDGNVVRLVVRQPAFSGSRKPVFISPPPAGVDARPLVETALARARATGANTLRFAPGEYEFLTTEPKFRSHLRLENLSDFVVEGNGARLNFHANAPGLWIQQSQRLRVENLTLNYALRTTSIGRIVALGSRRALVIDDAYPVDKKDKIAQIAELKPEAMSYVVGGGRIIFAPEDAQQASFSGRQTYVSPRLEKLLPGTRYMVLHHFYGGQAIKIDGLRTAEQTEDITLAALTVHSAPGMGVTVTGLRRGLAVVDSRFVSLPDGVSPGSVSWDGVHVHSGGGDILITGNRFELLGDDAVNLSNPIHTIQALHPVARRLTLAVSSRFIVQSDTLAFFGPDGGFQGTAKVVAPPVASGDNEFAISIDVLPPGVNIKSVVRTVGLIGRRYKIADNIIENTNGHAVLAQIPHGLIENNIVRDINRNAIRLLSDVGSWNEGVGAFNVAVRGNIIVNPGIDALLDFPWGAITAYSGASGRMLSPHLYNRDLSITDNRIENFRQGCITVISSRNVLARGNTCIRDPKADKGTRPRVTLRSIDVVNE